MKRPISVIVFAIINIVFAILGVIGFIWWLITRLGLVNLTTGDGSNPMLVAMENKLILGWV